MVANALKNNPKDVIRDQRGSLAVEVALIVPAIMFLLLAGVTLAHIVQLTRTTDRVAALMADDLSLKSGLIEEDFDTVLAATTGLIGESGFPATMAAQLSSGTGAGPTAVLPAPRRHRPCPRPVTRPRFSSFWSISVSPRRTVSSSPAFSASPASRCMAGRLPSGGRRLSVVWADEDPHRA